MLKIINSLKTNEKIHLYLFFIIFTIGFFFRFYNIPDRYGLDYDATRDALIAIQGIKERGLPLTGADSSVGPFHFGPWYYYFIIIFRAVIPWDFAPWLYVSFASLLCIPIFYKIGTALENKYLGLILAGLVAISPSQIGPSVGLSNPHLIPFYVSLLILILVLLLKNKNNSSWQLIFFGFVLGIGINHHYQMGFLFLFPLLFILLQKKRKLINSIQILIGIFISFFPLIFFEITNNFRNTEGLIYYAFKMNNNYIPNSWTIYIRDFMLNFWSYTIGQNYLVGSVFFITSIFFPFFLFLQKKLTKEYFIIFLTFYISFLVLRYYSGERLYYQALFLQPFIFILTGVFIWHIISCKNIFRFSGYCGLLFLFIYPIKNDFQRLLPIESYSVFKAQEEFLINSFPENKFSIYECGSKNRNRSQALVLLLHNDNKLLDNDVKIGVLENDCNSDLVREKVDFSLINYPDFINLSKNSDNKLLNAGFKKISPENVYNNNVKWFNN